MQKQIHGNTMNNFDTYSAAKLSSTNYQAAKKLMIKKFKLSNMGQWVNKPVEEELFT